MPKAKVSSSAKIWIFWENDWEEQDYNDTGQQLTVNFKKRGTNDIFSVTTVYARCSALEKLELWESLEDIAGSMQKPWLVGGDFNTIRNDSEKLGGLPVTHMKTIDFNQCISSCALNELSFKGNSYTWWNGRVETECISERLDRVFGNEEFMSLLPNSEVQHLIRQRSDHAPLHEGEITGNPFTVVHSKMKRVKMELAKWSKKTFGNVFQQIATLEDVIKTKEIQLEMAPTKSNRVELHKAEADIKRYKHIEEEYWKQKAEMQWFKDGDRNTKFFHAYVKGRRRNLQINAILTREGDIITTTQNIREEAVNVYKKQFMEDQEVSYYNMLTYIPSIIIEEQNEIMVRIPTNEEVKKVVFALNEDSASGPDGFSGFVKGRNITENVLLAQEIITDIKRRNNYHNVVVKLDMAKAYDRVSWKFLSFGFFQSTRGLKQGGPLSPILFIIATEVLSRGFKSLFEDPDYIGYGMPKWSPTKVTNKMNTWQNKLMSFGGRYILIAHVLQSIPVYWLATMNPPKSIIDQLNKLFAKFFWSISIGARNKHWVAWDKMCYPKVEGGLGVRSLHDVSKALFAKLWWNFRTDTSSLWASFMWNKYCKKMHATVTRGQDASHVLRKMITIREEVEHNIWWQIKAGNSSFWFDNWTKQGALWYVEENNAVEEEIEVKYFILQGVWDREKLLNKISEEMTDYIMESIKPPLEEYINDVAWWMGSTQGIFTDKSAWELMRHKQERRADYQLIWTKDVPFKMNIFLWRLWKRRIATDDNLKRMKIQIVSRCWCCSETEEETMTHDFLTAP
ncbi:uncharacterized protein LOC125853369 [Solanum stenotomum]|uniref:uncharacterized protein LOC125853369 n=1 Tax=Solanum stenotomum TaxID=172797 RepID=UPI0020D000AE|nr:uncharacterized protein LOC125853369 [Solanum stenotomum]